MCIESRPVRSVKCSLCWSSSTLSGVAGSRQSCRTRTAVRSPHRARRLPPRRCHHPPRSRGRRVGPGRGVRRLGRPAGHRPADRRPYRGRARRGGGEPGRCARVGLPAQRDATGLSSADDEGRPLDPAAVRAPTVRVHDFDAGAGPPGTTGRGRRDGHSGSAPWNDSAPSRVEVRRGRCVRFAGHGRGVHVTLRGAARAPVRRRGPDRPDQAARAGARPSMGQRAGTPNLTGTGPRPPSRPPIS